MTPPAEPTGLSHAQAQAQGQARAAHGTDEQTARDLDAADPIRPFRDRFHIPKGPEGDAVYLTGHSLGCQPKRVRELINQELEDWATLGVTGHHAGRDPWVAYHEQFREPLARLVGAKPGEVVAMNALTVNLHLLMVSFYKPTKQRHKIIIEDNAFPSDSYAVASQIRFHGRDPADSLVRLKPRAGEHTLRTEDVVAALEDDAVALIMLGAVNYLTGQLMDVEAITAAAHKNGVTAGWDCAHAAGNVPLKLHDSGADFAAWCSYKYLNSGPGAVAGAFVHERHAGADLPRFEGWWGSDPATRFKMAPEIERLPTADTWQLSNPPVLAMTPMKASLAIFDEAGIDNLRTKSIALTGYLERLLAERCPGNVRVLTPADPVQRGAQLSLVVEGASRETQQQLAGRGVIVDFREPNVIRAAPVPLYVSYYDAWRFVDTLASLL